MAGSTSTTEATSSSSFYEEQSDDVVFWNPKTEDTATWRGRAFALGEDNITDPGSYSFDKSLDIHGSPWGWLQDRARGIYIIDWPQAFDRLRDVPRLAVAEPLLGLYQNHMRPKLPELFVLRVAA